jgi:hypothetical protein
MLTESKLNLYHIRIQVAYVKTLQKKTHDNVVLCGNKNAILKTTRGSGQNQNLGPLQTNLMFTPFILLFFGVLN